MYIENEIRSYKEMHYRFARRLSRIDSTLVHDSMQSSVKGGKNYYYELWFVDRQKQISYLGGEDNQIVKAIKEKHFLSKALKKLDEHIARLEKCGNMMKSLDCAEINDSLPKVYRLASEHLKEVMGPADEEKWYMEALREKAALDAQYGIPYEHELRHKAKDGTPMRSKSEVSIFNEFLDRGKPCIYEMPTHIGPFLQHPDFTFWSNRLNRVMMWEHAGMIGDEDYMKRFSELIDRYIYAGLIPCVDVIFTFDMRRGDLDTGMIQRLLDEYE